MTRHWENGAYIDLGYDEDTVSGNGRYVVTTCILNSYTILSVGAVLPIPTTSTLIVYSPLVSKKFEFIKDERCMKIICFIDHSTIFDIGVGHEKDLSTYSIFYFFDADN